MAIFTLHIFCAGSDASCSYSGIKEQRTLFRKHSDFLGLSMSTSETNSVGKRESFLSSAFFLSFTCPVWYDTANE